MSEKAVKAVSMLVDRIRLTSFGLMLNVANLNSMLNVVLNFLLSFPSLTITAVSQLKRCRIELYARMCPDVPSGTLTSISQSPAQLARER